MENDIYVTITSNTDDPRNSGGWFFNNLTSPLILENSGWEVGVRKVIYYNSFFNIIDEEITYDVASYMIIEKKTDKLTSKLWYEENEVKANLRITAKSSENGILIGIHPGYFKNSFFGWPEWKSMKFSLKYIKNIKDKENKTISREFIHSELENYDISKNIFQDIFINPAHISTLDELHSVRLRIDYVMRREYKIPTGYYPTIPDLLSKLSQTKDDGLNITYKNDRISFSYEEGKIMNINLKNSLHYTFGFNSPLITKTNAVAEHAPQLNRGRFAFFIYSNLCDYMRVGNTEVQLLDVITIPKAEFATPVSIDIVTPIYRPVIMNYIHEIEIQLRSDSGEVIKFDNSSGNGKTLLILHFRRR